MDWFSELTAKLPRRNAAEPEGLREQIVAELQDHLECDFRRELVSAGDEATAWQRVRTKFGNPADVALRLWLDAMKGKLIMQKLSVAFLTVLVCLCLVMIGFMWNNFSAQEKMQRESLAKMSEQFKLQVDRLIEQIPSMQAEQSTLDVQESGDWRKFSLTLEVEGDAPADLFQVLINQPYAEVRQSARMVAGQTYEFGSLPPGDYDVQIFSPWGETYQSEILIGPGRENKLVVQTPATRPKFTEIGFKFSFQDNFKLTEKDRLLILASGRPTNRTAGTDQWSLSSKKVILVIDWQGKVIEIKELKSNFGQGAIGYFKKPDITAEGKIIFQNDYLYAESFYFAKLVSGSVKSGVYHYSPVFIPNLAMSSRGIQAYRTHTDKSLLLKISEVDHNGKPFSVQNLNVYDNLSVADYEINFTEQFADWYENKARFSSTCEYFNTLFGEGGGGFF